MRPCCNLGKTWWFSIQTACRYWCLLFYFLQHSLNSRSSHEDHISSIVLTGRLPARANCRCFSYTRSSIIGSAVRVDSLAWFTWAFIKNYNICCCVYCMAGRAGRRCSRIILIIQLRIQCGFSMARSSSPKNLLLYDIYFISIWLWLDHFKQFPLSIWVAFSNLRVLWWYG